jgi:hypothetical protein
MPVATTIVGIITAVATMATAVGGLLLAWSNFRTRRAVDQVHKIVNQQHTDLVRYQRALVKALEAAHIDVPDDQSIEPAP